MKRSPLAGGSNSPCKNSNCPNDRWRFGFRGSDFPNATFVGERTLSISLSAGMSEQDASDVAIALTRIFRYYKASA